MQCRWNGAHLGIALAVLAGTPAAATGACSPPQSLATALTKQPSASLYASVGAWFAKRSEFSCAAKAFSKAAALDPNSANLEYLLGLSLYSDGDFASAVPHLQQSIHLDPTPSMPHLALAAAFDATTDRRNAETQWRLALATQPASTLSLDSLSRDLLADKNYSAVIALLRPTVGLLPEKLAIDLSVAYTRSGLLEDASALLHAELRASPASLPLAEALAGVLILQNSFQKAMQVIGPPAKQHPSDMATQILYLHTLVLAHDPAAQAMASRLLTTEPHQWELLYLAGLLSLQANDYPTAKRYFALSVAQKPDFADSRYRLGVVLAALKDNAAARLELKKAISFGLDVPEVHFALAKTLQALGEDKEAHQQLQLYRTTLHVQAAHAQAAALAEQGDQAQATGNTQQSAVDYRTALSLDPSEPVLAYKLALALEAAGSRTEERSDLEEALRIDPHMAQAQNQLGYLDSEEGNTNAAVQHFELAVQEDPGYARAWMNLAAALALQSRWAEAKSAISHVLALDPGNAPAKELLQQISMLEASQ